MIIRSISCILVIIVLATTWSHAYSAEIAADTSQASPQAEESAPAIEVKQVSMPVVTPVPDKPASKSKPWSEMSASERTGFILVMPIVIPAVTIMVAWDIAVGTLKILGPGAADIINKYR
jgi:hypothetical protein